MSYVESIGNVSINEELGDWYLDYSGIVDVTQSGFYGRLDKNGIPLVDYDKLYENNRWYFNNYKNTEFGVHYTPITIAQYGLGLFFHYNRTKDSNTGILIERCADWFVNNIKEKGLCGFWEHTWAEPVYNIKPPWISAMAQGEAISLLLRAFQEFKKDEYFTTAEKAFNSFMDSDVVYRDEHNDIWFEEYPTKPPSHVLNGFIFALFGIFDFYRVTKNKKSLKLWSEGIKTLEKNIERYDSGYWTRYDLLFRRITSEAYHNIHINQVKVLYELTGVNKFYDTYIRWEGYKNGLIHYLRRKINGRIYNRLISRYKHYGIEKGKQ